MWGIINVGERGKKPSLTAFHNHADAQQVSQQWLRCKDYFLISITAHNTK